MEDASNLEPFTPRNRWRQLLEPMRAEAPALDAHLWETHLQVAELAAFRDRQVASWRGARWDLAPDGIGPGPAPGRTWTEPELRWALEAAAREPAAGPGSRTCCADLAAWMLPHLRHRPGKEKAWGGWRLRPSCEKTGGPGHGARSGEGLLLPWSLIRELGP